MADSVRLRHVTSGALVRVTAEKAKRMGAEWQPAEAEKKTTTRRTPAKSEK